MSPKAGRGGSCGGSAVHKSPNKFCRSNSIFDLCREPELPGGWSEERRGGGGGGHGAEAGCQYSPPHPG
jgi:hypothetical protein